ncbi:hypothetical protein I4574_18510 [Proteus mirabilis]|jgi:hypothetical protein|uniref:hypothetical protein n=1 Tax=Proteus mirabilis TaxID=584 RepID=UPI000D6FB722|nr:hypothetical protein [Proteus mirabilis]DAL55338.1 MAG TPA_asm: hypothetical protein [Caudoviricetes sp.]EKV9968276.1 hypothetical protein [Proteus mirabilis]MBG2779769.1 hypothetical protein [Proteus mirabilis]MBG2961700.1 hypothetical protein [Proteus mirabilis]MBI6333501.1 hypothetical protein [Proteus mirabilis]
MSKNNNDGSLQQMRLFPVAEVIADDIPMGVLNDGTPYLTLYGLAKLCGIDDTPLRVFTSNWETEKYKPRGQKVSSYLTSRGYENVDRLYTRVVNSSGIETHAYPDYVCMAVLRYYAFDASNFDNSIAIDNFVRLAEYTLKRMIYEKSNYKPSSSIDISFNNYRDRVMMNDQIPVNYFSVFRECADIVIHLINKGFPINDTTMPDGSVGQHWGKYWNENKLFDEYGERIKFSHTFPDSYRQSKANSFVKPWVYPIEALGEFRKWLYNNYAMDKLEDYLKRKKFNNIDSLLEAVRKPELPNKH